ncbi:MAG: DUF87 domain-containing protein [Candidatus Woesebacteria bacterium]
MNIQSVIDLFKNNLVFQIISQSLFSSLSLQNVAFPSAVGLQPVIFILFLFLTFLFIILISKILIKLMHLQIQLKQRFTFLEVIPPLETLQSAYTTQQLFTLIHGLAKQGPWLHKFIGYQKRYAFEIVSSKNEGIRYLLRVNDDDADIIKKGLLSYLPGIKIKEASDYLSLTVDRQQAVVAEFIQSNHFAFPLKRQNALEEHDPIAYMTGSMTKLAPDEIVAFQVIASPLNKSVMSDIKRISHLIYKNDDLVEGLQHRSRNGAISTIGKFVVHLGIHILMFPIGLFVFIASGGNEGPFLSLPFEGTNKKTLNPYQAELELLVKGKLDQQLFTTSIRLLVIGKKHESYKRIRGFTSSLSSFANSYQSLRSARSLKLAIFQRIRIFKFQYRLLGFVGNSIFSVSEISDIYHFPFTTTTHTEDIQKVHSRDLPAPVSLKRATELDVVFAANSYAGTSTPIGLNVEERRRHMYILGATGTGKSTLLLSMIKQDIEHGKGLCVIDPHGELIESILPLIPENRIQDVVYFNPDDIHFPVGLNLLELPPDALGDDLVREKELIAESVISLFHKVFGEQYSGPRMEYILRNAIHTAFTIENATLFTIYTLLMNEDFRKKMTKNLTDQNLRDFWKYEFDKAGDYQQVSMISPITNKIGRFLFSPVAKRILEQEKSTIDFDDILNSGKILLCNVSKGKIGEDNSQVFGALIMTKIQLAALKRARIHSRDRRDFYFYVDEFQNFATPSFAQILSEARKYKLNAILAHQTTSQLEDKSLVNVTLANTGTIICFRTANPEDERLILPQFAPSVQPGEISNLPSYHFYIKISALEPEQPFSGETTPVTVPADEEKVSAVIQASRSKFTKEYIAKTASVEQTDGGDVQTKRVAQEQARGYFPR